jgi:hypothetical protein
MNINISSNISTLAKAIDAFGKNQIPFATHRALNDTAFALRGNTIDRTYPKSFDVKNKQFPRALLRVKRSRSKRDLVAEVYDHLGREYMTDQAEGGTKTPRGTSVAIPARDRPRVRGRASYNRYKPRTILGRPRAFIQKVGDQTLILERRTKNRYPLKLLYLLHEGQVRIPSRFPFYKEGLPYAQKHFNKFFAKQFAAAKRTARR